MAAVTVQINFEVPEDIASILAPDARGLQRAALEGLALEGVRSGRLSRSQAKRLLGFATRYEVDGFMKDHGVPIEDSLPDIKTASEAVLSRL